MPDLRCRNTPEAAVWLLPAIAELSAQRSSVVVPGAMLLLAEGLLPRD